MEQLVMQMLAFVCDLPLHRTYGGALVLSQMSLVNTQWIRVGLQMAYGRSKPSHPAAISQRVHRSLIQLQSHLALDRRLVI